MKTAKIATVAVSGLLLIGCSWFSGFGQPEPVPDRVRNVITALPEPDQFPDTDGETLPIHTLTDEDYQDYEKVARYYAISIEILLKERDDYADFIDDYRSAIIELNELREELEEEQD